MAALDMNLVVALDALLEEGSVTRAAQRLHTSPAAMSRTLARIRRVLDDPVLVRAGQAMVMTPRAAALRGEVHALVERGRAVLAPAGPLDPSTLHRTFTVQASDLLLAEIGEALVGATTRDAPGVTVRFLSEALEDSPALRDGLVDVEVGVIDHVDPETLATEIAAVRLVGAVRAGHPLATGEVTPERFAAAAHIAVSRRGLPRGPVDERLAELGLTRRVALVVPSHTAALLLTRRTDLVCLTPAGPPPHPLGLHTFPVPLELPARRVGMAWHPRTDADPGHRWFRNRLREAMAEALLGRSG